MNQSATPWWGFLIALAVLAAATATEVWTVWMFRRAIEIENWPTTQGTIFKSALVSKLDGGHEAQIEYKFRVDEKEYTSKQVRTRGTSTKHKFDVEALVAKFPVGQQATVYYSPSDPSDSYLEVGVDFINYILIVSPLLFAILAGYFVVERLWLADENDAGEVLEANAAKP